MSNQEILTKAIEKAAGFDVSVPHFAHPLQEYEWNDEKRYWYLGDITIPLFEIIYQHSFAKALWGNTPLVMQGFYPKEPKPEYAGKSEITATFVEIPMLPMWQYHLQQMVITDDPIAYLGEHI